MKRICYQVKRDGEDIKGCRWATEMMAKAALKIEIEVEYGYFKSDLDLEADVSIRVASDGKSGTITLTGWDGKTTKTIEYTVSKIEF